jgi:HEAT repeat protein
MVAALHACVVRVRATAGRVVGAGFLVTADRVATCAHVVRDALGLGRGEPVPPRSTLQLDLPLLDGTPKTVGEFEWWDPDADLAVLSLRPVPGAAPVVRTAGLENHPVTAFGFPAGFNDGMYAGATVLGRQGAGRYHLQAKEAHGFRVQGGFSGGPVWDDTLNAVVGMVVSSVEGAGADDLRSAFMVPLDRWVQARPEWGPVVPAVQTPEEAVRAAEAKYLRDLAGEYLYLKFRGIEQAEKWQSLPLDDVFIDLRAFPERDGDGGADPAAARRRLEATPAALRGRVGEELLAEELQAPPDKADKAEPVPVASPLAGPGVLVVLGGPGSGKTTFVKRLARSFALGEAEARARYPDIPWCFPVAVAAAVFATGRAGEALLPFLRQKLARAGGPALETAFDRHWAAGRCLVLVDGLDEIADAGDRVACAGEADKLIAACGANRVVVSSRPVGYRQCRLAAPAGVRLTHTRLTPLGPEDVEAFAYRWHEAYDRAAHREHPQPAQARLDAAALLAEIRGNPQVADLARNPLMLTIVALIKHQQITLPDRRAQLYETVLNTLIISWNRARNLEGIPLGVPLSQEETRKVWAAVAHAMHAKNTGTVTRSWLMDELTALITASTGDEFGATQAAEGYLKVASEGVGLLEARGANAFAFLHQTFQEYLAARHLTRSSKKAIAEITAVCHDPRWHEVVRLAAGYIGVIREDEELVSDLVEALAECPAGPLGPYLFTGLRLAAACLADDVRASVTTADAILRGVCDAYRQTTCEPVRAALIRALGRLKTATPSPTAATVLKELLTGQHDWRARMQAARFLGRCLPRDPVLAALFAEQLHAEKYSDIRAWLAHGLFEFEASPEAETVHVLERLAEGIKSSLTGNLVGALSGHKDRLNDLLRSAGDSRVRLSAAKILIVWGLQPAAAPALAILLADDAPSVRLEAARTLRQWGPQPAAAPVLTALLADPDPSVRLEAARTLGGVGRAGGGRPDPGRAPHRCQRLHPAGGGPDARGVGTAAGGRPGPGRAPRRPQPRHPAGGGPDAEAVGSDHCVPARLTTPPGGRRSGAGGRAAELPARQASAPPRGTRPTVGRSHPPGPYRHPRHARTERPGPVRHLGCGHRRR